MITLLLFDGFDFDYLTRNKLALKAPAYFTLMITASRMISANPVDSTVPLFEPEYKWKTIAT